MQWQELPIQCKRYLFLVYLFALPFSILCLVAPNHYGLSWILLTLISLCVSTVNVRLPKISSVLSIADVFTILALMHFGPGPALITYWLDVIATHFADMVRRHGVSFVRQLVSYRFGFNLACSALSVWTMYVAFHTASALVPYPASTAVGLIAVAITWFLVNTVTISLAVSLLGHTSFWAVWREGVALYFLTFSGAAVAAGLISTLYQRAGFPLP